jgi:integrase
MGSVRRAPCPKCRHAKCNHPEAKRAPWEARYRDPAGKQRTRTFRSKADAAGFLRASEVDVDRGLWVDPALGRTKFGYYAATWLATKADVSARTRINIEGRLKNHILPVFEDVPVASIAPSDVRGFVSSLSGEGLAPSTVKGAYLTLAQVLRTAAVDGLTARSPCIEIELPSDRHREEMHFLDARQVDTLADAIKDRYRTLVYTAAYGGLRAGELVALKVTRVNVLARNLDVVESVSEVRGRLEFGPTKTGKVRTIGLPAFLAEMVGAHIGRYPSADGLVFTAAAGGPIRWRNFYARAFQPAVARAAGLPDRAAFPRSAAHMRSDTHRERPAHGRGQRPPRPLIHPRHVRPVRPPVPPIPS